MEYYCVYKLTFPSNANPPGRVQEVATRLQAWFEKNDIRYGMGAQGGIRRVYGMMYASSVEEISRIRQSISDWIRTQPMQCDVQLGQEKPVTDSMTLAEKDWAIEYRIDSLTEQDRKILEAASIVS